jgi:excisionase family DNA binding protein
MPIAIPTIEPVTPSVADAQLARTIGQAWEGTASLTITLTGAGKPQTVTLTAAEFPALQEVLKQIVQGKPVTVLPLAEELSTQQAADLLNVSRPFLIRLLEEGEIAYRMVGSWRRVPLSEVLAYKRRNRSAREAALAELAAQAQELNMGY